MIKLPDISDYIKMPSGLIVPEHAIKRRPKAIDLFSGCGGASCGVIQAGFEVVAAADNEPYATITYLANLGTYPCNIHFIEESDCDRLEKALQKMIKKDKKTGLWKTFPVCGGSGYLESHPEWTGVSHFFFGDICKLTGEKILETIGMKKGEVDLVFGSPPCQGFSTANTRRKPTDPRNNLVFEFARLVMEIKPKTMCMERVKKGPARGDGFISFRKKERKTTGS